MPAQKGRRQRQRDRRRERSAESATAPAPPPAPAGRARQELPEGVQLPSTTARVTGFIIAVVTLVVAALMIRDAAGGGTAGAEAIVRIIVAVFLIGLALAVGALSVAPLWVRSVIVRLR